MVMPAAQIGKVSSGGQAVPARINLSSFLHMLLALMASLGCLIVSLVPTGLKVESRDPVEFEDFNDPFLRMTLLLRKQSFADAVPERRDDGLNPMDTFKFGTRVGVSDADRDQQNRV
jgi:hypothetical protein